MAERPFPARLARRIRLAPALTGESSLRAPQADPNPSLSLAFESVVHEFKLAAKPSDGEPSTRALSFSAKADQHGPSERFGDNQQGGHDQDVRVDIQRLEGRLSAARSSSAAAVASVIVAALLAAEVARLTIAAAVADENPQLAMRLAPGSPAALAATAMESVGKAAARGAEPDTGALRQLRAVAVSDPLGTEPFLVEGALAERAGSYARAMRLLAEARARDPRSAAARYLYADTAVRQGRVVEGLKEIAVLSRLMPSATVQLVPSLAEFARTPQSRDQLAAILAENPQLKNPLLLALAANPDNAELILALSGAPSGAADNDTRAWQARLLLAMVGRGDYQRAYQVWRRLAGQAQAQRELLFNGSFRQLPAPPPFNWEFSASRAGLAEPGPHRLRVVYYGREEARLATQLLILPPGTYRFQAPMTGDVVAGALSWSLTCVGAKAPLMDLRIGRMSEPAGSFTVPASGCPAQRLQLNGHVEDSPEDSDVRIGPAAIARIGG